MNSISSQTIGYIFLFFSVPVAFYGAYLAIKDVLDRHKQRRIVRQLKREFDEMARIKARIVRVGGVLVAGGDRPEAWVLFGHWRFEVVEPNTMARSTDNAGVTRAFGYTKEELIYAATHPSEFGETDLLP